MAPNPQETDEKLHLLCSVSNHYFVAFSDDPVFLEF